jgi:predicted nucleotide-binding protein
MIEQLEQLCFAVGNVREADARSVVDVVNRRLCDLLNAEIAKLYWREEAQEGVILRPISYVNRGKAPEPQQFPVQAESRGVLERVFTEGQPLWLDNLRRDCHEQEITNHATKRDIPVESLNLADPPQSDAMVVVPIRERGVVFGIYSVELQSSELLSERVVHLMQQLGRALGSLLYNVDMYEYDVRKSGQAIAQFIESMRGFAFPKVLIAQNWRTAFVARPYAAEFGQVQTAIERSLAAFGVRARHYIPDSQQYVVEEIIDQIENAHFCVADLTGNNSNVIAEIGMMMVLRKRPLLLKRQHDEATIPFDLRQFNIWEYELGGEGDLLVRRASEGRMVPFGEVLEPFLGELPGDTGFKHAAKWDAQLEGPNARDDQGEADAASVDGSSGRGGVEQP